MVPGLELRAPGVSARVVADGFLQVTSLVHAGRELLVSPSELPAFATVHGRCAGITFLHPWANRLAVDSFTVAGVTAEIDGGAAISRDAGGLALHGTAAGPGAWRLSAAGPAGALAELRHDGSSAAFPFPHSVTVSLALRAGGLSVATTMRTTGAVPVPIAFGWHPYLRLPGGGRGGWLLRLPERRWLVADARGLPNGAAVSSAAECAPLASRAVDDGFDGLPDGALMTIESDEGCVGVRFDAGYPVAQVFAPPGLDVVSLEPMTAPTNALVSGRGLRLLQPGEEFSARFTVEAG